MQRETHRSDAAPQLRVASPFSKGEAEYPAQDALVDLQTRPAFG
jgi:hypothetical protein